MAPRPLRESSKEKILVTGGTGFIGKHLVDRLIRGGWSVVATTRERRRSRREGLRYVLCDLTSRNQCGRALRPLGDIRCVIHCAALRPGRGPSGRVYALRRHNLDATINLLSSLPAGVEKFIFASTLDVYGAPQRRVITEEHPLHPQTCYGVFKLASEGVCRVFCARGEMGLLVLRLVQVYGEGEPTINIIPRFIEAALEGRTLAVEGNGRQKRSYLHVQDVVEAFSLALRKDLTGIYNLGGERGISILAVARLIRELTGKKSGIAFRNPGAVCPSVVLDSGAIREAIGFRTAISMESGLRRQIGRMRAKVKE